MVVQHVHWHTIDKLQTYTYPRVHPLLRQKIDQQQFSNTTTVVNAWVVRIYDDNFFFCDYSVTVRLAAQFMERKGTNE